MFHNIRWRIVLPYLALILFTMFGLGIYLSSFVRQTYMEDLEAELVAEAKLTSEIVYPILTLEEDLDELDILVDRWSKQFDVRITVIDAGGTVLSDSHANEAQMDNHSSRPEILQAKSENQGISTRYSQTLGEDYMYVAVSIPGNNGEVIAYVRIALPLKNVKDNIAHLQSTLLGITLFVTVIAIVLALWIAERTMRPLRELTQTVAQMSGGNLTEAQIKANSLYSSSDEIGQLTRTFNIMAVQLRSQIEELETERSKMAAVLSVMTDGALIVDARGNIQLLNPAAESMFEINQSDALGYSLIEVLRNHELFELWQRCQESDETQFATFEITPKRLYLQGVATPLGDALPGNSLLLFQNLTHIHRLETIRQDFISNVSHELRTPLASLKALAETLLEGALEDPPAARRFLQRMETEVDALSLMVSELLELSRIESGRVPLDMRPTPPTELVVQAVERLRLQAERAGLDINIDCPRELPLVLADNTRLEQVLVNLLHNAIKFTPAGGKIEVSARQQEDKVLFSIQDTGIGIPEDDLPRIFERFYKSDRARSGGGTGLGLAIARHLVESHKGKIWAESVEGQGSTFFFTIPIAG